MDRSPATACNQSMNYTEPRLSNLTAQHDAMGRAASLVKWVVALACAHDHQKSEAAMIYQTRWPNSQHVDLITKAAVNAASTTDSSWAGPLVPLAPLAAAFMDLVRPRTVLGRLIGVRKAPFNTRFTVQTSGTLGGWVGENKPTPVGVLAFAANTLTVSKLGLIVPLTAELVRSADPAALPLIERDMVNGIAQGSDAAFLDPAVAAVAGTNPASVTNGTTEVPSGGSTAALVEADLLALIAAVNGGTLTAPAFVLKSETAIYLSRLRDVGGARTFPDIGFSGGSIGGFPRS